MKTIDDVPVGKVWKGQQAALMRLQLYAIGRTHKVFSELTRAIRDVVLENANNEGKLDGLGLYRVRTAIEQKWIQAFNDWKQETNALRIEAAAIPFGTLVRLSNYYFQDAGRKMQEALIPRPLLPGGEGELAEAEGPEFVFRPQIQNVMDAANQRVYGDGLNWSGRVWNLDRESLAGIQREVFAGVADGDSAWNISKRIEKFLGAGQDCPRWTRTRLYGLTKKDIASGDRTGLYSGDECDGQGVAYKALRLARNEVQIAHHLASDAMMSKMPWVEKEQVNLSPAHPEQDVCDDVVAGGEDGKGVYEVGTIVLPIHVQCLCFKAAVQMPQKAFTDQLRGWMNGTEGWEGMDEYAQWLGVDVGARASAVEGLSLAASAATSYAVWLWGDESALRAQVQRATQLGMGF